MNGVIAQIAPRGLLPCSESSGSAGQREGSEIARKIVHALTEAGIGIFFFVTRLYDLAENRPAQDTGGMHQTATT